MARAVMGSSKEVFTSFSYQLQMVSRKYSDA
jgi:hypothetical protein